MNIKKILFHFSTALLILYVILYLPMFMFFGRYEYTIYTGEIPQDVMIAREILYIYRISGNAIVALGIMLKIIFWKTIDKKARMTDIVINIGLIFLVGILSILRSY